MTKSQYSDETSPKDQILSHDTIDLNDVFFTLTLRSSLSLASFSFVKVSRKLISADHIPTRTPLKLIAHRSLYTRDNNLDSLAFATWAHTYVSMWAK